MDQVLCFLYLPDLSIVNILSVFVLIQKKSNYYPNYPLIFWGIRNTLLVIRLSEITIIGCGENINEILLPIDNKTVRNNRITRRCN